MKLISKTLLVGLTLALVGCSKAPDGEMKPAFSKEQLFGHWLLVETEAITNNGTQTYTADENGVIKLSSGADMIEIRNYSERGFDVVTNFRGASNPPIPVEFSVEGSKITYYLSGQKYEGNVTSLTNEELIIDHPAISGDRGVYRRVSDTEYVELEARVDILGFPSGATKAGR